MQIKGIAMGLVVAPSIANIFMNVMEEEIILTTSNPYLRDLLLFKHFIDDIYSLYTKMRAS